MAGLYKRKAADELYEVHQVERPILKRRNTSQLEQRLPKICEHQQQYQHDRNDSAQSNHETHTSQKWGQETLPQSPPHSWTSQETDMALEPDIHSDLNIQSFRDHIATFTTSCGSIFGPKHLPILLSSNSTIKHPTSTPSEILTAGNKFINTLDLYLEDLRATTLNQVQLRATLVDVGVDKSALVAIDALLEKLDEHIVSIGAHVEGLKIELQDFEAHIQNRSSSSHVRNNDIEDREIAML